MPMRILRCAFLNDKQLSYFSVFTAQSVRRSLLPPPLCSLLWTKTFFALFSHRSIFKKRRRGSYWRIDKKIEKDGFTHGNSARNRARIRFKRVVASSKIERRRNIMTEETRGEKRPFVFFLFLFLRDFPREHLSRMPLESVERDRERILLIR